ncbi:MAG: hypothetical protein QM820_36260 [Minicystis sp.]
MTPDDFKQLPYARRQLVLFLDDELVKKVEEAAPENTDVQLANFAFKATYKLNLSATTNAALDAYIDARGREVNVMLVPESWAGNFITLPPAHPRPSVLYAGHPATAQKYVPLFDFHRFLFEHKFAELVAILMHLGATRIKVKRKAGWGRDLSAALNVGLPQVELAASATAESHRGVNADLLYEAELDGTTSPELPPNLVWYPHEPTWQQVAEGRLRFGLKSFSFSLEYSDDYGVNLGLKAKVEKAGLDAGGAFHKHQATIWLFEGEFLPKAAIRS